MSTNPWIAAAENLGSERPAKPARSAAPSPANMGASYAERYGGPGAESTAPREATGAAATSYADRFVGRSGTPPPAAAPVAPAPVPLAEAAATPVAPAPAAPASLKDIFDEPPATNHLLLGALQEKRAAMPEDALPKLLRKAEKQIRSNLGELSLIEGNLMRINRQLRTIYCTSCFRGEGKTTTAVHTSYGLAEFAKRSVLLIDTDGDNPQLHDVFRTGNQLGLAEVLSGNATPEDAIVPTQYPQLFLLPAGNGHISVHGNRFARLLDHFKANFEFIVMDGKSLMVSSSPSNVAPLIDVFLLTVECESTKWEVVQMANEKLAAAGAAETAVVLNKRQFYVPRFVYKLLSKR